MRWALKPKTPFDSWRSWFAWHPVRIGDERIWLERIERRPRPFSWGLFEGGYDYRLGQTSESNDSVGAFRVE